MRKFISVNVKVYACVHITAYMYVLVKLENMSTICFHFHIYVIKNNNNSKKKIQKKKNTQLKFANKYFHIKKSFAHKVDPYDLV